MDLLTHWRLRERPFEAVWDARFFFPSRAHEEALHRLRYLAAEQTMNVGLLTGEIGCGKTLTCAVFGDLLDTGRYCLANFEHARFDFAEIVAGLLAALEEPVPPEANRLEQWQALSTALGRLDDEGRHLIALFDEAQDFEASTLRELKALTNLNGRGRAPLTLIFAGQSELRERVATLPSLAQRVGLRFHLRALSRPEADEYLAHRLRVAGHPTGAVFDEEAARRMYEISRGLPRELNRVAKLALEQAWFAGARGISREAIEAIVNDGAMHE